MAIVCDFDNIHSGGKPAQNIDYFGFLYPKLKNGWTNKIRQVHRLGKKDIYFYDDTYENIQLAVLSGYVNSYLVRTPMDFISGR